MKKFFIVIIGLILLIGTALSCEADASQLKAGDYVSFGSYGSSKIIWRCLSSSDGNAVLISDEILCFKSFDAKGIHTNDTYGVRYEKGTNQWYESTLRKWLNSNRANINYGSAPKPDETGVLDGINPYDSEGGFLNSGNFTNDEYDIINTTRHDVIANVLDENMFEKGSCEHLFSSKINDIAKNYEQSYRYTVEDMVYLPSITDIKYIYDNADIFGEDYYLASFTPYAMQSATYKYQYLTEGEKWQYWLVDPLAFSKNSDVYTIYHENTTGYNVAYNGGVGVRPMININLNEISVWEGSGSKDTPYNPVIGEDYTNAEGKININGFTVTVKDGEGAVEDAFVKYKGDGSISVVLPGGKAISYTNRVYVTVVNSVSEPAKDIAISVEDERNKVYTDKTDANGLVISPSLKEDITNSEGSSGVEETKPNKEDETKVETIAYKLIVSDTKGVIKNAFVKIEDGELTVTLPETHSLTTANQTTVTVSDNDGNAVKDVYVTVRDKANSKSGNTDANGKVTLPVIQTSTPSSTSSHSGGGSVSTSVSITDKDGKSVAVTKSVGTSNVTLTLPAEKNLLKDDNYYTITVKSGSKAKANYPVTLKDMSGNEITGTTNENGVVILSGQEHKAYIFGYTDGTFRPDSDMTRGEAAAILARLISEEKKETISGNSTFTDVSSKDWCSSYIGYLEKYDIIKGFSDKTFKADNTVTRAEFVTMAVRYYRLFNEVKDADYKVNYTDLKETYWAYKDIAFAKNIGWISGYADGSFKGDNNITRAEVVTVINHATERIPDKEYINENVSTLNKFTDLKNNSHWGYYDIILASNNISCINCSNLK